MEIESKDYTGKPLGTARKWLRWVIQFPFGLGAVIAFIPAIALGIALIIATILGVLAVVAAGVIAIAVVVAIPATLFLVAVGLGPFEVKDGEEENEDVEVEFE